MRPAAACALALLLFGCAGGPPRPAMLDARNDACGACRMAVSNPRFAAQIVAPGEEPVFFDDIGCLADYLRQHGTQPARAMAYVADHRTSEWVPAAAAIFTSVAGLDTPMGSHVIAHASALSRDADAAARAGTDVPPASLFPTRIPDATR
jgi:copper chaperone NosL